MPSFLRRFKHPFRRPTHYYTYAEPRPTSSHLARIREREKQRAEDERENDLDDGFSRPRSPTSCTELPIIVDSGQYGRTIYPSEELYYNSIMYANGEDPPSRGGLHQPLRQEIHRTLFKRNFVYRRGQEPYPRPEPNEHLSATENGEIWRRWNEWHDKYTGVKKHEEQAYPLRPKPKSDEHITALRGGLERHTASPRRPPAPPPSPRREPITPGTPEWDAFMDFPSEHSVHLYRDEENDRRVPVTVVAPPSSPKSIVVAEAPSPVVREIALSSASSQTTQTIHSHSHSPSTEPGTSLSGTDEPGTLTWNSVLNRILVHEAVDPATRTTVRVRVQRSSTTNGSGHADVHPVAAVNVGLVPNFSYPVTGSAFYDRLLPEQPHPQSSVHAVSARQESSVQEEQLQNSLSSEYYTHGSQSTSNETLYRASTPTNRPWPLTDTQTQERPSTNGVPAGYYGDSSSSDSSLAGGHHPPLPPDRVPDLVFALLCEHLTASERSLHRRIVTPLESPRSPPSSIKVPLSNATSPTPLDERLVKKLHALVYGLQDRVDGLEEDLVPQLATHLEDKTDLIDELSAEVLYLHEDIAELKRIVDFGNTVLARCWEREWEEWRTLLDIRKHRETKRSRLTRLLRRRKSFVEREYMVLEDRIPEGYVSKEADTGAYGQGEEQTEQQIPLENRELNALLLMGEQNVRIIKEDMEDMAELVQAWQERAQAVEDEEDAPAEESRRDS
jgi:hypothetical protein